MLSGPNAFDKMLLQSMSPGCLDVSIYSSSTVVVADGLEHVSVEFMCVLKGWGLRVMMKGIFFRSSMGLGRSGV